MKLFSGLKLHPNGFLGAPLEVASAHPTRPIQVDLIGAGTRKVTFGAEGNALNPNTFVEELFKDVLAKEDILKRNFEFRERLYLTALRAFGTGTINDWVDLQRHNPYFDTMQNRFVEETVGYVFTGFRKYHPSIYLDTLDIGDKNAFSIGPNVRAHLLNRYRNEPVLLREFLQKWLSQRDGISDLVTSLRVLFGS